MCSRLNSSCAFSPYCANSGSQSAIINDKNKKCAQVDCKKTQHVDIQCLGSHVVSFYSTHVLPLTSLAPVDQEINGQEMFTTGGL